MAALSPRAAASLLTLAVCVACGSSQQGTRNDEAAAGVGNEAGSGAGGGSGAAGSGGAGANGGNGASGSSGGGAAGSGGSSGGTSGAAGNAGSSCPATPPSTGSRCATTGTHCSYGDSPFPECRDHYECVFQSWQQSPRFTGCTATPPEQCPPMPSTEPCNPGARCAYDPSTLCTCATESCGGDGCVDLPQPTFLCNANATPGCPARIPNAGTACEVGLVCAYEGCGTAATCDSTGTWTWGPYLCP